jgi:phthalate 4,5-dioxygenase oxygenase subunit
VLTREENELLTRTGAATPGGEMLRRYWLPAALSEELPDGGAPLPVRLLGEDLVLFRNDQRRPGLLGLHCTHRGADLSYGRIEDGGLRCLYHGWLYNIHGECLDQPGEPAGSDFCRKVRQPSYPCQELGGVIFAYLGPGDPPLLPRYEFLTVPANQRYVSKNFQECNYLQGSEGNIDPVHNNLLHHPNTNLAHVDRADYQGFRGGRGPVPGLQQLDCAPTDFGLELCDTTPAGPDRDNLRTYNFVMPSLTVFPGPMGGKNGYSGNWHIPIDDVSHWKYTFIFSRYEPLDLDLARRRLGLGLTDDYHLVANKSNRYLQDRSLLKTSSYTGIDGFAAQDTWAIEGLGPIYDRTQEHLGQSDKIIIAMRKLLLDAIEDVKAGKDPRHVVRPPAVATFPDMLVWVETVPKGTDWREFRRQRIQQSQGELSLSRG